MTGKPFYKTRTITSERLVSPLAGRRDLNDAAIAFKKAVLESITRPTLNAGLSVKALDSATGNETYKDTDGKKRTSKGGTPGMVERLNGYNYLPGQKWEEGKILNLFPSVKLRNTAVKKPNFGWVDEPRSVSADEYARILAAKPKLRIRKYKVNPKTDEIIEESEQTLDPFSLNGDKTVNSSGYAEKRLPGRTIGQRGRSLIARAASAFGIIVDENGKFRCPPGTPAANQFTDNAGTNCFGISASEIFDFAKRMASGIDVSKETGVKHTTKKLFEFISWLDNGAIPGIGRTVWRDENGKRIKNIKKWREASLNDTNSRVFVDGMIRAQDKLAQQDINIASLMDTLGVIRTDEKRKTNEDVFEVFQKLRDSGAWTIDTSTRLSAEDIDKIVKARLLHVPGFSDLTPERQKSLIAADTERWYTTERALLESALDSFIADPEHMRTIASINFQVKSPDDPRMDEASTGGYTTPDSKRVMSIIYVDIPEIMNNQEAMIPSLAPGERMRIDFVGGKTDSERATALTDFLVTVDGHSKQLAAMVEERAFARHIMKHEIAHTIQMQAFNREAERQIRTNGFITVLNDKGEPVKVESIRDLTSEMVMSLMAKASDGIDLESLKNALSRTDVVGFLAGEYPKMYFNDEYGAEHWALEAAAELWALRDLGLIYGDDIDAALEWMDDVSDGRYIDIRRRSDADGLRDIEARYYENLGPDPELSGNSIAEVKKRLEIAHKKELSLIEEWSQDSSTTSDDFIDALAGLEYDKESYNLAFDNLEATGESKDSPAFKNLNRKIKENNAKIALIEKKWAERFSSEDSDRRRKDVKAMRESVREKMFSEGTLRPEEMAARTRQQEIKNLQQQAEDMTEDEFVQKLADIEISLKEPGLSADDKSVLLEDKKMLRAIFKSKLEGSDDAKVWAKQRRELDTRIDEIVNPPRQQALKKTKKVKTDKAGASYAKKIQRDESLAMTEEQAIAVERLGDPSVTDIGNLVDPDGSVAAIKNINRRYRRAQRSAGDLSPESETAALEDQIEKVLIPAMEAMDESSIPDDLEIEAEIYFGVTDSGFKDVSEYFDSQGFISGRIITDESPHKPGEVRDADGDVVTRAGKEKTRVIVQVSKGDKGLFRTNETELGDEGALVLPPGKMKVVDVRPDGTVVLRVQEQDNVVDVLDRVSSSIGEEGPGASQHAKGTKKKIDRVANKYVAQRRENGLSSTPSRPKRDVEIEDKNVEVKREVISAGGSFGEPPSEDYVAETLKQAPYSTSAGSTSETTPGSEVLGIPQTREERKVVRATRANMTFEDIKRVMAGESPKDVMNDMSRDSLDSAVADEIARKSPEALIKDVEDAAVEFHAGVDKRPRVRMTESQLTKFADDGEFLPTETDDIVLESGAIGRRLERRLNPATRRSAPKLSSGRSQERAAQLDSSVQRAQKNYDDAVKRVENLEEGLRILEETGEWRGGDLGVTIPVNDVWTANGVDRPGETPKNLTADEVAEIGGIENLIKDVKEKIRISKIEARHQEDVAARKKIRREQGVLDVEDIPDDVMTELKEEASKIAALDADSDEYKAIFSGSEPDDLFVYHAGASELDGGILDPRRSVGSMEGASRGAGDTRGLNNRQIEIAQETISSRKPALDALKSLSEWKKNNPQGGKFIASSPEEARQLENFGLIGSRFKIDGGNGLEYEIPESAFDSYGYREIDNTIGKEQKFLDTYQAVLDISKRVDGQFLSSYPAGTEIVTGGYFGRFAPKTIPEDIASVPSEFELRIQQASQQIKDREAYDRWMSSRRGTAWLIGGKEGRDITSLLGPGKEEKQILGEQKPIFGISQLVSPGTRYTDNGSVRNDILKEVGPALMARAIRLKREGKEITPAAVLGARAGKPLDESSFSSGGLSSGGLSSGARYEEKLTSDKTSIDKANKNIRKRETKLRFTNSDGREYSVRIISTNTNRDSYDLPPERELSAYLSDDSGKIVGAFFARSGPTLGRRPEDVDKLVISDITVDENLHRQGLGRAMLTFATKYNVDEEKIYHSNSLSPLGAKFAAGTPIDNNDISLSSGRRNKINRRGPIDRFILEKNKKGDEVRNIKVGTSSISNPEKIDNAEYLKVVGDIPGVSDTDELISTEKLTSSRVPGLEIFRGTYRDKKGGEKNRVFGKYKAPDDVEYTMVGTELGMEGRYYAYPPGSERLDPEMDKVAKLSLTLNDGELNVHDLFNIEVNTDKQKLGLAQALVEMAKADFPDATFTTRRVVTDEGAQFARNLQSARGGSSGGSRLSSGRRSGPSKTQRVAGIAGSRATGRVLDAVLKRSGADEDTRERVKYGVNMAGALAAGGPAGFATALAVDVARRAGREIAERGLEEAVQRGRITQNQMDVAMQAVDRVAPNGLPDPVVDKLADAWSIASDFIDERVVTDENRQRLDEFGDIIRGEGAELLENAGEIVGSARDKVGKKFKKLKKKKNTEDGIGEDGISDGPDLAELRSRFGSESLPASSEYDDPFDSYNENDYTPAKTEYDPFGDSAFSSGKRAGRSSDAFRDEYNSRIGISKSTPNSAKPVSGYVVHRSHNEEKKRQIAASGKGNIGSDAIFEIGDNDVVGDGLTALGEIEVILKPEVSNRTAYGRGEALQSAHRPVAMNSNDPDDIADAIMNADGISSKKQNTEAMLHLLGAKMDKNFSSVNASMDENGRMAPVGAVDSSSRAHEPFEAQILGGFKKSEVEGIHYPYTKVAKIAESEDISDVVNDRSLASKLEKLGFTPEEVAYFYSISGGKPLNTASMVKLKEYRAAKKIKERYEGMGIGYVKFAHPQGINIENPRSYDKTAAPTTRVDEILKRNIDAEVEAELKKTLDSVRKNGQLDLMVD